jgi:NAD(P)-dependent dehydrogenase (short-subunit alcohol dehydrogenase family)
MAGILDRKVALVTGGASGIGRATSLAMAREGARVAVADRTEESAAATVALINAAGGQAIAIGGDVTVETDVAAMVQRTVAAYGGSTARSTMPAFPEDKSAPESSACTNSARTPSTPCSRSISGVCSCASSTRSCKCWHRAAAAPSSTPHRSQV